MFLKTAVPYISSSLEQVHTVRADIGLLIKFAPPDTVNIVIFIQEDLVVHSLKLFWGIDVPGYASIIVLILFFGSMQLFGQGIIGEYVGRTFEQTKNRPIYIAKEYLTYEEAAHE